MPMSGWLFSSSRMSANTPNAIAMPGKPRVRWPSASSQAATTAKQGLRNSLGCSVMPGSEIQRRAPLISTPATSVIAVSSRAAMQPASASRRTPLGDSSDTLTTTQAASARNTTCLRMKLSRLTWMRSATAGLAASIIT